MFPLFISQQSSQKIALLLIQELLLQTLQLVFFPLICLFLLTNKRHNPLFQTAERGFKLPGMKLCCLFRYQ